MRRTARPLIALALAFAALPSLARPAHAAWPANGLVLAPASGMTAPSYAGIGRDDAGGVFVAFVEADGSGAQAFRVFHVDGAGDPVPGWPAGGVRVGEPAGSIATPDVLPDGAGGLVIAWSEYTATALRSYALRLTAAGAVAPGWTARGTSLSSQNQLEPAVAVEDGAGGLIAVWRGPDTGPSGLWAQHLLGSGTRASGYPAAGRSLTASLLGRTDFLRPAIVRDPGRGFWISYTALGPDSVKAPSEYRVAHLVASGAPDVNQPPGGVVLGVPHALVYTYGRGVPVALALDQAGGTFAFAYSGAAVRGFHVMDWLDLDPDWPADGTLLTAVAAGVHPVMYPALNWPAATADGEGGAYVGWGDATDNAHPIVARMRPDGSVAFAWSGGIRNGGSFNLDLLAGADGFFVSGFMPLGCPHFSCYGPNTFCRFDSSGAVAAGWPNPSPQLLDMPGMKLGEGYPEGAPRLCGDGAGGVFATWYDAGVQHLMRWLPGGPLDVPAPGTRGFALAAARFVPGAGVRAAWTLPGAASATLELFDVGGRRRARERLSGAGGEVTLAGTRALAPGLYFLRLAAGPRFAVARVVVAR